MKTYQLTLIPVGKVIEVNSDESLLAQIKRAGYNIKSSCGGCASCGDCIVKIGRGDSTLSEISFEEKQLIGNVFHMTKERLSCQTRAHGDLEVDISEHLKAREPKKIVRRTKEEVENKPAPVDDRKRQDWKDKGGRKRPKTFSIEEDE